MISVKGNWGDLIKLLINAGANLNLQDKNMCTALIYQVENGSYENFGLLVESGADLNL
jgi:ankyrin repeat protein